MLYKSINFSDFCDEFRDFDRQDSFSYEAKKALFNYLDDFEENLELDILALCCDFTELSYSEIVQEYSLDIDPEETNEILEWLECRTIVVWYDENSAVFGVF